MGTAAKRFDWAVGLCWLLAFVGGFLLIMLAINEGLAPEQRVDWPRLEIRWSTLLIFVHGCGTVLGTAGLLRDGWNRPLAAAGVTVNLLGVALAMFVID